ncbi:MAG: glutathione S-transferase [Sandaracinaceae bacterium]|nr:glutathione S-transferase [Sandaracinaceae bacterium]
MWAGLYLGWARHRIVVSRLVRGGARGISEPVTYLHYGTEVSLYSGKTRAYLRYKGIPFEDRVATIEVYRSIIVPEVGRPVIPVVRTPDGELLQDTTVIIDALEQRFPEPSIYPEGPMQRLFALLLEVYGDEWLVMPAMHYRWHPRRDNLLFLLRELGRTASPRAPRLVQPLLGLPAAMFFGRKYQAYFGVTPRMHGPIERSYEALLRDLDAHLADHAFLFGTRPSIGDLGLIGPLYAHLYRDPAPGRLMRRIAPNVARWVERMQQPEPRHDDGFLPDDEVPETLYPLLARMFDEQLPILVDTIGRVHAWALEHPDRARVSRIIGAHRYQIEGVSEERKVTPFSQWMFQRPLDLYASLDDAARARIDPVLERLGGLAGLRTEVPTRLAYRDHRLVVEGR